MCGMCEESSPRFLSCTERAVIEVGLSQKMSMRAIARQLRRDPGTISREVARNKRKRRSYDACEAQRRTRRRRRRPQTLKLLANQRLGSWVQHGLDRGWSPQQISGRAKLEFPHDRHMRISHETIYQSIYVLARGELKKDLKTALRTGRTRRKAHGRTPKNPAIKGMVNIADRPAEVADRAVPGHWEGDLICGPTATRSRIATLVERTTRYTMLVHLGQERSVDHVADQLAAAVQRVPSELARSLTWDQGLEMRQHHRFTAASGLDVYFCDPHSPWQRGTNENTNGLLRQYFPKGTDLSVHDPEHLLHIERLLNGRPRKVLNWATPTEAMTELLSDPHQVLQ